MKAFDKFTTVRVFALLIGMLIVFGGSVISAQTNRLITSNSVGNLRIGMTVEQARRALSGFKFSRGTDGEGIAMIEIGRGKRLYMTVFAGEFDVDKPIDENAKIEFIEVFDSRYRTARGVFPRMRLRDVEQKMGKLKNIVLSEIEAREFGTFTNQPDGIDIRLQGRNGTAGVYGNGQSETKRYSSSAYVFSIIVIGGEDIPVKEVPVKDTNTSLFSSKYTDLRSQCKTPRNQGRDGGHISTYCDGFDNYRVHIYDTARTMEISVESTNSRKSTHIASQSLSFNRNSRKIEWRFKNGKPFAVIMRGFKYRLDQDGLIKYPERRTGEYLFVRGLPGFEWIKYDVTVNSKGDPNAKARQMADDAYNRPNSGGIANNAFQNVNINQYNRLIDIASGNREAWIKSSAQVVLKVVGEMREVRSRTIRFVSPSAEGSDQLTVTVTDDGLLDDSVRTERLVLKLKRNSKSAWRVLSGQRSWRCRKNRGHQNYSAVRCS